MKQVFSVFALFFVAFSAFPQSFLEEESAEKTLMRAEYFFDSRNYGDAVALAELAKERRQNLVDWCVETLDKSLHSAEVRAEGDSIARVTAVLEKREEKNAADVLACRYVKVKSPDDDSVRTFLEALANYRNFPEADFLLGKIYILSGEYELARKYLMAAWDCAKILDVDDEATDILYALSDVAARCGDDELYEKSLLAVVARSQSGEDPRESKAISNSVLRALKNGIELDKFFGIYRRDMQDAIAAHFLLAQFYRDKGETDLALSNSAVGCLAAFTCVCNVLQDHNADYQYCGFDDFLRRVVKSTEIAEWSSENNVWGGFFDLADLLAKVENRKTAAEILETLATNCPDEYWKNRSLKKIIEDN